MLRLFERRCISRVCAQLTAALGRVVLQHMNAPRLLRRQRGAVDSLLALIPVLGQEFSAPWLRHCFVRLALVFELLRRCCCWHRRCRPLLRQRRQVQVASAARLLDVFRESADARTCAALRKLAVVARLLPSALATRNQHCSGHSSIQQPRPMAGLHDLGKGLKSRAAFRRNRAVQHEVVDARQHRVCHGCTLHLLWRRQLFDEKSAAMAAHLVVNNNVRKIQKFDGAIRFSSGDAPKEKKQKKILRIRLPPVVIKNATRAL